MRTTDVARRVYAETLTAQFIREIDPDGTLAATDPEELDRRLAARRSIHFRKLAIRSAASRQAYAAERRRAALTAAEADLDAELAALTEGAA